MELGPDTDSDISLQDLSTRVQFLEQRCSALEALCTALVNMHPDSPQLRDFLLRYHPLLQVDAHTMNSMGANAAVHEMTPEEKAFQKEFDEGFDQAIAKALSRFSA